MDIIRKSLFYKIYGKLVEQGFKVDKGFKPQTIQAAIQALKDTFGVTVNEANVSNHLRTIRRRWASIKKIKRYGWRGLG